MVIFSRTLGIAMITVVCAALVSSTAVQADPVGKEKAARPAPAVPLGGLMPALDEGPAAGGSRTAFGGSGTGVQSGADHVRDQQCVDGGWGWPHASCPNTFNNITAPIALGLLQAYEMTADATHLTSATDGGDFDLTSAFPNATPSFGSFAPGFLHLLTGATGDGTYSSFAETGFFDALTAGTYADPAVGSWAAFAPADTFDYIARHKSLRSGSLINLRPWDMQYMPWVAGLIGNADSTTPADGISQQETFLNDSILDGLNTLVAPQDFDLLGLAGGIRALAMNGTTSFTAIANPADWPAIDLITDLCDLVTVLLGFQNADGSWSWKSDLQDVAGEQDTQTTAYAVLALLAAQDQGCVGLDDDIDDARAWMWTMQEGMGGFKSCPSCSQNVEVEGEVLTAMTPPDEVFVDDDFCDGCANDGHQWGFDAFDNLQDALNAVGNSTINVAPGTYIEAGQIVIASDVNIIGDASSNPVIMTDQDTGSSGDARGWWLVNAGITLVLENLVLDGTGFKVWQGIRSHGTLTVTDCTFREIKFDASGPSYAGTAMTNFDAAGPGTLTATDCIFTEIGRIGIHVFGPAVLNRCTYTGKGVGDFLDYFVCVGSFGASVGSATINSCTVTGNRGVASVDGSTSAGMLVTTFFGAGTTATLTSNIMTDNTTGLVVGFDSADTSIVVANFNQLFGNDSGLVNTAPSNQIDAENNWWGDADGPEHVDDGNADDVEIDLATCDTVSVDNMKNELPGGSLGDTISEGADFCPWLEGAGSLVLLANDCQDDTSGEAGNQIEVELHMLDLSQAATGFQAFVEYPTGSLSYRGDLSSYTSDPFALHITGINQTDDGLLDLDGSVGFSPPQDPTKGNALLATLVFDVLAECGVETVNFEVGGAFGSELSLEGVPLSTNLENVSFTSDDTDPVITTCPDVTTVECDGLGNAGDLNAWLASFAASDTCSGPTLTNDFPGLSNLCGATGTSGTVTFTATDDCGNFSDCTSTFTIEDTTNPVITGCPGNIAQNADAGGCTAVVSWTAPTADDDCELFSFTSTHGPGDTFGSGTTPVTYTATDDCGLVSTCEFNVLVSAVNDFAVDIELAGVLNDALPLTRCIHFVTDDCNNFADIELDFTDHDSDAGTALRAVGTVEVGCGAWTQLCVKDEQHTLYSTATVSITGTTYTATPVSLRGGDTDNDSDDDINDVTLFLAQFGDLASDGGCPWDGTRDADFSNNGAVGTEDYTFLTENWLTFSSCSCTTAANGPEDDDEGLATSVSVFELPIEVAKKADLNNDGVVDYKDVRLFELRNGLPQELSTLIEASSSPGG